MELAKPLSALLNAGYEVTFASPKAKHPRPIPTAKACSLSPATSTSGNVSRNLLSAWRKRTASRARGHFPRFRMMSCSLLMVSLSPVVMPRWLISVRTRSLAESWCISMRSRNLLLLSAMALMHSWAQWRLRKERSCTKDIRSLRGPMRRKRWWRRCGEARCLRSSLRWAVLGQRWLLVRERSLEALPSIERLSVGPIQWPLNLWRAVYQMLSGKAWIAHGSWEDGNIL